LAGKAFLTQSKFPLKMVKDEVNLSTWVMASGRYVISYFLKMMHVMHAIFPSCKENHENLRDTAKYV